MSVTPSKTPSNPRMKALADAARRKGKLPPLSLPPTAGPITIPSPSIGKPKLPAAVVNVHFCCTHLRDRFGTMSRDMIDTVRRFGSLEIYYTDLFVRDGVVNPSKWHRLENKDPCLKASDLDVTETGPAKEKIGRVLRDLKQRYENVFVIVPGSQNRDFVVDATSGLPSLFISSVSYPNVYLDSDVRVGQNVMAEVNKLWDDMRNFHLAVTAIALPLTLELGTDAYGYGIKHRSRAAASYSRSNPFGSGHNTRKQIDGRRNGQQQATDKNNNRANEEGRRVRLFHGTGIFLGLINVRVKLKSPSETFYHARIPKDKCADFPDLLETFKSQQTEKNIDVFRNKSTGSWEYKGRLNIYLRPVLAADQQQDAIMEDDEDDSEEYEEFQDEDIFAGYE